jgi:hypothetical protein
MITKNESPDTVNVVTSGILTVDNEKAFQDQILANGVRMIEGMRTGAIRHCDGHRPWLTRPEHPITLTNIVFGAYQVDVTLFTKDQLREMADRLLREMSHVAKDMKGYTPLSFPDDPFAHSQNKGKVVYRIGKWMELMLKDSQVEIYPLITKNLPSIKQNETLTKRILVSSSSGSLWLVVQDISSVVTGEDAIVTAECQPIETGEAVELIEDWRDFVRFLNRLQGLFRATERYYNIALAAIKRQSFHQVSANLIHGDPDVPDQKVNPL